MPVTIIERTLASVEAVWAAHHVKLDPEPPGDRSGLATPGGDPLAADARLIRLQALGDSMVAGCGVSDQKDGLVPALAKLMAETFARPVRWEAEGRLGATMRRVRHRMLPRMQSHPDVMVLCAGSNDIMAQRSLSDWSDDLSHSIDIAQRHAGHVIVISSGQIYTCPSLGRALRHVIEGRIDEQTAASARICAGQGVTFIDLTHADVNADRADFWAHDRFHPGKEGYRQIAAGIVRTLPENLIAEL